MGYLDDKSYPWLTKRILFVISFFSAGATNMNVIIQGKIESDVL